MKISVEFSSWTELCKFLSTASASDMPDVVKEQITEATKEVKEEAPKKEKKAEKPVAREETKPEPEEEPEEEAPKKEKKADPEELRLKARKALAKVNKQTKENTAKEWISDKGYDSLADIEDPDVLDELIAKAEEFLNA